MVIGRSHIAKYGEFALKFSVLDRVIFAGFVPEIKDYYAASDIFVFPTRYEPFGLVITEAMASGLPVITSEIAGAAEIMTDGRDAILLKDPTDSSEIAEAIRTLVDDDKLRASMGANARRTAEKYSWDEVARKTMEVYEEVAESKRIDI